MQKQNKSQAKAKKIKSKRKQKKAKSRQGQAQGRKPNRKNFPCAFLNDSTHGSSATSCIGTDPGSNPNRGL
jgi:hypothetical protein